MNPVKTTELGNLEAIPSPALLVFPDRVEANVDRMLKMVNGDVSRLRPHVKTHKMAEVVRLQVAKGITQFKCATEIYIKLRIKPETPTLFDLSSKSFRDLHNAHWFLSTYRARQF